MSLRQRGQRPSESTNEGGYYAAAPTSGSSYNPSPPPSGSNGYPQTPQGARRTSSSSAYTAGGYYNASPAGYPPTPSAATPTYHSQPPGSVQSPYHPQTAPPAYNRDFGRSTSNPLPGAKPGAVPPAPRAIQFDSFSGSSGYGGYGGGSANNLNAGASAAAAAAAATAAKNPYQKSKPKSSSGFTCKHFLLTILFLTFLVLTGTTLYFRKLMKDIEADLQTTKKTMVAQQRSGGRFNNPVKNTQPKPPKKEKEKKAKKEKKPKPNTPQRRDDAAEKKKIEEEIKTIQQTIEGHRIKHQELMETHTEHSKTLASLNSQKQDLLKTFDHTKNLLDDAREESAKYKAMVDGLDEVEEYMKKREGALWQRIQVLEGRIARDSRREAEEWFGPGPHSIEIELEYPKVQRTNPDPNMWPRIRNKFTIRLAPLDLMPHTVNLFLQQVHHGLWRNCRVVSSASHIYQIGPRYDSDNRPENQNQDDDSTPHYKHFLDRGLDKVSFQEYHKDYPHVQWTVGLAGRPGGPDFYINKSDNTLIHGPGGQTNEHDLHNEADPCFGKVVEGLSTLDEIELIPTDPDRGNEIKYPVVVVDARILVPNENPEDGWRVIEPGTKLSNNGIMPLPNVHDDISGARP